MQIVEANSIELDQEQPQIVEAGSIQLDNEPLNNDDGSSLIQGTEPSFTDKAFDRIFSAFKDPEKEKAKAVQAIVDAEDLKISPHTAYTARAAIDNYYRMNPSRQKARDEKLDRIRAFNDQGANEDEWKTHFLRSIQKLPYHVMYSAGNLIRAFEENPQSAFALPFVNHWMLRSLSDNPTEEELQPLKLASEAIEKKQVRTLGGKIAAKAKTKLTELTPASAPDGWKETVHMASDSLMNNLLWILPGLKWGKVAALTGFGAQAAGQTYGEQREGGSNPQTAFLAGTVGGLSEALTELIPVGIYLKPSSNFIKQLFKAELTEIPTEQINTIVNSVVDKVTIRPDMTIEDMFDDLSMTFQVTALSVLPLTTMTYSAHKAIGKVIQKTEHANVFNQAKDKALIDGKTPQEALKEGIEAVEATPDGKAFIEQTTAEIKQAAQDFKPTQNQKPIILGVDETVVDGENVITSFTMADPITGDVFTVPAIQKIQGDTVSYMPDQNAINDRLEKTTSDDLDAQIDRMIEGDDTAIEQVFGKDVADFQPEEDIDTPEIVEPGANMEGEIKTEAQEGKGEKLYDISSVLNPEEIVNNLRGLTNNIKEAMPHLEALGRQVYQSGKIKFNEWSASMKETLGDLWEYFKDVMQAIYNKLKEERGSISNRDVKAFVETPEGQYTLSLMQQELQAGEAGLMIEEGVYGESGLKSVTGRFSSHMPWAREIMHKHKVDSAYLNNIIEKYLNGKELTDKQFKIFADIRRAATKRNYTIPEEISQYQEEVKTPKEQENVIAEFKKLAEMAQQERNQKESLQKTIKELRAINNQLKGKVYFSELNKEQLKARYTRLRNNIKWMAQRKETLKNIRDYFGLTDEDMSKISRKNPLLMDEQEFAQYLKDVNLKAIDLKDNKWAKIELMSLIEDKRLQKVDNYRRALKLPSINEMTTEQLRQFARLLEPFQYDDVFLTQRELETVDKTDLKGIKTWREAKERLAKEAGVPIEKLANIKVPWNANFRWDSSLREQDPFFDLLVSKMTEAMMGAEMKVHNVETMIYDLAKKAEKSRKRGLIDRMIPQDELIFAYLESPSEEKNAVAQQMTPEQIRLAHYMNQYFSNALNYLIAIQSVEHGRENYITHIRKSFMENMRDKGIKEAIGGLFTAYQEDQMVFNILDNDTGNILPLEKFFQYSLHRTGELDPTKNVVRAFMTYVAMFEKKKAFDAIIPKLDIYTQSLTPVKYTPRGLEFDRSLKRFVNKWINNKKGRKISYDSAIRQGGPLDLGIRALRTITTMIDLGFYVPAQAINFMGEQITTMVPLGYKDYAKSIALIRTEKGKRILKKYEFFTERSLWEEFTAPGKEIQQRLMDGMFGLFHISSVAANKQFLLASMTEQEWANEELSPERLAQIKLDMGRFRAIPGTNSLVGSTSLGKSIMQYKAWAVPPTRTLIKDISTMAEKIKKKQYGDAFTADEAKEIYRIAGFTIAITTLVALAGDDDDDGTFIGKMKARAIREIYTLTQGMDPTFWLSWRSASYLKQLGTALKNLLFLEEYKTKEGLKGVDQLKRAVTPGMIRALPDKEE